MVRSSALYKACAASYYTQLCTVSAILLITWKVDKILCRAHASCSAGNFADRKGPIYSLGSLGPNASLQLKGIQSTTPRKFEYGSQ
ncbi:unnamed protein product [Sphenostylis stenocarpa]|uniref:Uncharacterized protein n=1 Tax=Sphenostylis stenocarpa TaxID=92480 RepID=A0AA86W2P6_9FABA|nr:unnamed protein product [Sphenostylis stenocarpa]